MSGSDILPSPDPCPYCIIGKWAYRCELNSEEHFPNYNVTPPVMPTKCRFRRCEILAAYLEAEKAIAALGVRGNEGT